MTAIKNKTKKVIATLAFFFLGGIFEIGGGYLVWLWLREGQGWVLGALGGLVLFMYGIVQTFHPTYFHRIYAAYGGVFIVMAIFWGWAFDGIQPDRFDVMGMITALVGVAVIFYWPRKHETLWTK